MKSAIRWEVMPSVDLGCEAEAAGGCCAFVCLCEVTLHASSRRISGERARKRASGKKKRVCVRARAPRVRGTGGCRHSALLRRGERGGGVVLRGWAAARARAPRAVRPRWRVRVRRRHVGRRARVRVCRLPAGSAHERQGHEQLAHDGRRRERRGGGRGGGRDRGAPAALRACAQAPRAAPARLDREERRGRVCAPLLVFAGGHLQRDVRARAE